MPIDQKTPSDSTQLPAAAIHRLSRPFARFLRIESAGGGFLLVFTLIALALSNSPWADGFAQIWETPIGVHLGAQEFTRSLRAWINDGLMTMFFFLVALELKRELVFGDLKHPRMAALPIAAALGGMLFPAAIFLALQWGQPSAYGWGTVMTTDTAFVVGCLALLGTRTPQILRVFMLTLAIVDDIGAIVVVALGYSHDIAWGGVVLAVLGLALVRAMSKLGLRSLTPYFVIGGMIWLAADTSGIHPTITGVLLGLMAPARRWVSDDRLYAILGQVIAHPTPEESGGDTEDRETLQVAEIAARETLSPAERLEIALHPWVGFVLMPLFALANAGLPLTLSGLDRPLVMTVFLSFVLGKPCGIMIFSWLAVRSRIALRPPELGWRLLAGGSLLAGIGFTMALFIAEIAFSESLIDSAKLGIFLASVFSAIAGLILLQGWSAREKPPGEASETES